MCSIAGLLDKNGHDVKSRLISMLEMTSHRGPDGCGILIGNKIKRASHLAELGKANLYGSTGIGHLRLRITGLTGTQPLLGCYKRFVLGFNGEIWNYEDLRNQLKMSGHVFETDSDSEVVIHLLEENYKKSASFIDSLAHAIKNLDGEWALAVFDTVTKKAALARDLVGIKQLYYGQNSKSLAFCSEKKPLWQLDIKPTRVLPGQIVELNFDENFHGHDFKISEVNHLNPVPIKIVDEIEAIEKYKKSLFDAVQKRVRNQKRIGIIFSGGVDSVVIAQIAKQLGAKIVCYASGDPESSDVLTAKKVADDLDLELRVNELSEDKISSNLENIISAIESTDHLQVDVAIPVYFAVDLAASDGIKVMLTGQGADELFAGYPWYPEILKMSGQEALNSALWNDIKNLYKDTLEREDKITMSHSIELRVPYLDPQVISVAMSISPELKIGEGSVKFVHRRLAESLGIPQYVAWRPKEAAQHGSDAHNKLHKIILQKIKEIKPAISEKPKKELSEKLGSAYRYNYKVYSDNALIQQMLNYIGNRIGINS